MEGSKCPLVCGIDARVVLDQQCSYVHVLDGGEEVDVKEEEEVVVTDTERTRQKMKRGRRRRGKKFREELQKQITKMRAESRGVGGRMRHTAIKAFNEKMCEVW